MTGGATFGFLSFALEAAAILGAGPVALRGQDSPRLRLITTAHQFGPVGYRDPLGAISPSGRWLAWSVSQHLFVRRVEGGPVAELPAAAGTIRYVAWLPDDRTIAVDGGDTSRRWWTYDAATRTRSPLWPGRTMLEGRATSGAGADGPLSIPLARLEQLTWSSDGRKVAGVAHGASGTQLWVLDADGGDGQVSASAATLSFPAWSPDGSLACLSYSSDTQTLSLPCGAASSRFRAKSSAEAYGPLAFSPDGKRIYLGVPNAQGTLDLWARSVGRDGPGIRVTGFANDSYAPSVARNGEVLFKRSDYRTFVSVVPADGGPVTPLALFQSMTPSWSPKGDQIALTFGNWRRVVDDFHYPDIAQDIGIVSLSSASPAVRPDRVVLASPSEDQSMCWSPNGKWIALHSHKDRSDDLWIGPADGSVAPKLLTHFGRNSETDWPRWSPDGRWVLVSAYKRTDRDARRQTTEEYTFSRVAGPDRARVPQEPGEVPPRHVVYVIGVDPSTGTVTQPPEEVALDGFQDEITHGEWAGGSDRIAVQAYRDGNRQTIYLAPRAGGRASPILQFRSEQHVAGFSVSPDGAWIAYVAPATDGRMQLFRARLTVTDRGEANPEQLTFDPSDKTQPAYSPDGTRIALTVWSYDVEFWMVRP
jgi:Tol biopolymer transport system component